MLGGFTWASSGTLGRAWEIGDHKKGHLEVQAWIFFDLGYLGPKNVFLLRLFPGFFLSWFLDLDNLDVQDWKTKRFVREVLQKSPFAELGIFMIRGFIFFDFG